MYTINAEFFIVNYFAEVAESTILTLGKLTEIKRMIEKHFFEEGIFLNVDLSRDSLLDAVDSNRKYFSFNSSQTAIKFNSSQREIFYEDVYAIFNSKVEKEIRFELLEFLEKILSEPAVS